MSENLYQKSLTDGIYRTPQPAAGWDENARLADRLEAECKVRDDHPQDYDAELTALFRQCVAALRREAPAPSGEALADWSELPKDIYVIGARRVNAVGFDVQCCSVPMVTVPEVRYVRADMITSAPSRPAAGDGVRALPDWQQRNLEQIVKKLTNWRNEDHEDTTAIWRSDVCLILDALALSTPSDAVNAIIEARESCRHGRWDCADCDSAEERLREALRTCREFISGDPIENVVVCLGSMQSLGEMIDDVLSFASGDEAKKSEGIQSAYGEYTPITVRASTSPSDPPADIGVESRVQLREAKKSEGGCICQDQHRRGYCTEPGCPHSVHPSSPPADRREIVARIINTKVGSKADPNFVERRWLTGVDEAADAILAALDGGR